MIATKWSDNCGNGKPNFKKSLIQVGNRLRVEWSVSLYFVPFTGWIGTHGLNWVILSLSFLALSLPARAPSPDLPHPNPPRLTVCQFDRVFVQLSRIPELCSLGPSNQSSKASSLSLPFSGLQFLLKSRG